MPLQVFGGYVEPFQHTQGKPDFPNMRTQVPTVVVALLKGCTHAPAGVVLLSWWVWQPLPWLLLQVTAQ